ncbi:hypothetical protein BT96DRAFT_950902 [Gymnopus androsaceus JB14]|uniref:Uncharacterized protein n=1 Tax=Gymnopus androsaceus JB14 TaxID=1447944 RepID=A0A6A4GEI5_9AGAR|nr:hypothetical protein BT96DRAFT_950902 [Gymnopus androsaceus JB14]
MLVEEMRRRNCLDTRSPSSCVRETGVCSRAKMACKNSDWTESLRLQAGKLYSQTPRRSETIAFTVPRSDLATGVERRPGLSTRRARTHDQQDKRVRRDESPELDQGQVKRESLRQKSPARLQLSITADTQLRGSTDDSGPRQNKQYKAESVLWSGRSSSSVRRLVSTLDVWAHSMTASGTERRNWESLTYRSLEIGCEVWYARTQNSALATSKRAKEIYRDGVWLWSGWYVKAWERWGSLVGGAVWAYRRESGREGGRADSVKRVSIRVDLAPFYDVFTSRSSSFVCYDHSPRMVAYKAKYGKYMATTWSAAFLLGVQRLCTQMLGQYARKDLQRYKTEWFIEEPILTYTFIGGDEIPGLLSPVVTPSELISGGLINYHNFAVDFELSVSGLAQDELFPKEAIFISDLCRGCGPFAGQYSRFLAEPSSFPPKRGRSCCRVVDNMFIDFEAVESENEHQTDDGPEEDNDDGQEEEEEDDDGQEPKEEDDDHDIDVEKDPSPIDNEVEFVGEAVEQPVRIRFSMLEYPTSLVPKPISSIMTRTRAFLGLRVAVRIRPCLVIDSVLARGGGKSRAARTSNAAGTPYPETKGVRMITERFAAPGDFNDNERVQTSRFAGQLGAQHHSSAALQCSMPPESTSSARHECHRCLLSKTPCSFSYPVERADEERRRLFMHAARSNGAVAMFSSTLVEENLGLLRTEVLLRSFLTEFKIQASNVARRQAQLRNSASDPRSLLKALIEDGFVAETDTERLSMLAFLLGWDKRFTLEDLEFEGLSQIPLPEVIAPPPTQSQVDRVPPIPGLVRRPQYKGKGKAKAVEAASEEGSAPEEASTVVAEPVSSSGSSEESEEEASCSRSFRFSLEAPFSISVSQRRGRRRTSGQASQRQPSPLPRLLQLFSLLGPSLGRTLLLVLPRDRYSALQVLIVVVGRSKGRGRGSVRWRLHWTLNIPSIYSSFLLYAKILYIVA